MKKIPLWKMIVLSIITLSYYEVYWLIVQKSYLVKETGVKLPSSWWLIGAAIATVPIYILLVLVPSTNILSTIAMLWCVLASLLVILVVAAIRIWWMTVFLHAADKLLKPRATFAWMLIHLLTLSFNVIFIAQYYFNHKPNPTQKQPSRTFVVLSIMTMVFIYLGGFTAGVVIGVMSLQNDPQIQSSLADNKELNELAKQTVLLKKQYDGCVKQLDDAYLYITNENESSYQADSDACEAIRIEQNQAVDAYETLSRAIANRR